MVAISLGQTQGSIPAFLPPELWLHIFESECLDQADIANVTLIQQSFRWLAQQILFKTFQISHIAHRDELLPLQTQQYIDRVYHRLDFVSSERIVHAVQNVILNRYGEAIVGDLVECSEVINALFSKLHLFHKLSGIYVHSVLVTKLMLSSMYAHPMLRHLQLINCDVDIRDSDPVQLNTHTRSHLATFHYADKGISRSINAPPWWTTLFHPQHITSISLPDDHRSQPLLQFMSSGPILPALWSLDIATTSISSQYFGAAMANCPSLSRLAFCGSPASSTYLYLDNITQMLHTGSLPLLKRLRTHPNYALPFVRSRGITQLNFPKFRYMEAAGLIEMVEEIKEHCSGIQQLDVSLDKLTSEFLKEVLGLRELLLLSIRVREYISDVALDMVSKSQFLILLSSS